MSSTYLSLHYHVVFSTRNRIPFFQPDHLPKLHNYLGGMLRGMDGIPQGIGGVSDHVHLLFGLKSTHCLADVMRELKKKSSMWVHETLNIPDFVWQEGYAAFSVSATNRASVQKYIANQPAHHHQRSYREELMSLLEKAGVSYDQQYLD